MMRVFLTGATGVMGLKGMEEILHRRDKGEEIELTVLARPGERNRKKLDPYVKRGVNVIWGDLLDEASIDLGVSRADIVLHVGGMVSPAADFEPEKTFKVNTISMANIIKAARIREDRGESISVVYIGSVAQYGSRPYPNHWGRSGDPICTASFDKYALSKIVAELMLSESGLKRWVSIRQTSVLHPGLLGKADNPVAFHVPMAGALEWVTDEDSGRLLASLCRTDIPDNFWREYYNVGGGESYRMSNYNFMKATLEAVGCPPPEKVFELRWFATRNFHGIYFLDSDRLDNYLHYRSGERFSEYIDRLKKKLPFYYHLAPLAPATVIKMVMGKVAEKKKLGTRRWISERNMPRIEAAYGSLTEYEMIPDWRDFHIPALEKPGKPLSHGYDETKELSALTFKELRDAAIFRGGKLLEPKVSSVEGQGQGILNTVGDEVNVCDPDIALEWSCSEGHRFRMTPRSVLKGGHWCPECLQRMESDPKVIRELASKNAFLSQLFHK